MLIYMGVKLRLSRAEKILGCENRDWTVEEVCGAKSNRKVEKTA